MSNWNGTILGPPHVSYADSGKSFAFTDIPVKSAHENRIYSLNIHCGEYYPDVPPTVQFVSKINLPCVDQRTGKVTGQIAFEMNPELIKIQVDPSRLPCLFQWKRENTMETILIELRRQVDAVIILSGAN